MTPQEFAQLAAAMRAEVAGKNTVAHRLVEPYCLILVRSDDSLRLYIGLRGNWPTLEQTRPLAEAFGVPAEDLEPKGATYYLPFRFGGRPTPVKSMQYTWTEHLPAPARPPARQLTIFAAVEPAR